MVNKKKRIFKLLFFPISLLLCLSIFLINSFAQSGYDIQSNGDIVSLNLFDKNNTFVGLIRSNNGLLEYDENGLSSDYISVELNETYHSNLVKNWSSNYGIAFYDFNKNFVEGYNSYSNIYNTFTITNDNVKFVRFSWYNDINSVFYTNKDIIMFNKGLTLFDYFPYGYYYANGVYNNLTLYNLFNGGFAGLYLANNLSGGFYESDNLSLSINQKTITLNDLPNIRDYLYSNTQNSSDEWIIVLFMPHNVSSYGNLRLVYNPKSYNSNFYCNLSNDDIMGGIAYFPSDNINVVSLYSNNYEFNLVAIHGYYKYFVDAFELSLNTFDSGYYNQGYSDGFNNGSKNGIDIGYNSGYQSGYNDGINTDLQTNGLRTLFNSILSFPVDMIKSVFNFEFMGVNIASVIMFIVSIGIVAFVIKKFL